jgi:hypothetical protein
MSKRLVRALPVAAALCLAAGTAAARPPDLPVETKEVCVPVADNPVEGSSCLAPPTAAQVQHEQARQLYLIGERCRQAGDLDMAENCYEEVRRLCPRMAAWAQVRLLQVKAQRAAQSRSEDSEEVSEPPALPSEWDSNPGRRGGLFRETDADERRLAETRKLYLVGERCRRGGDLDMAYRWYEEAHQWCPHCAYGRKALRRMREIDAQRGEEGSGEEQEPPKKQDRKGRGVVELVPVLPGIDPLIVDVFNRMLTETESRRPADLVIVEEERSEAGSEEESESRYAPLLLGTVAPASLFVAPPVRDLTVREEKGDCPTGQEARACHDLSDWFREAVRTMRGAGSLRVEAGRLGHLLSGGEAAVRELGCALVHEGGRCYVVYPAPPR